MGDTDPADRERARGDARRARARAHGDRRKATGSTLATDQPVVAIVGFPNVGKSTLFNRLSGRRDAVVDSHAGVTRDRRQGGCEWNGRAFQLIDTGGIDTADPTDVGRQIAAQAVRGIEEADLVMFVVDVRTAPTAGDLEIVDRLRRAGRPVMLVANKCDGPSEDLQAQNLRSLGLGEVYPVSAQHGRGAGDLLDAIVDALPAPSPAGDRPEERMPALCILGRPNVGKSSILNALLGEDRMVVHDRPGTTRDPVDTIIEVDGRQVVLIDTAGLRKRGRMREGVEHYSQIRALQAAERSDVALVVADATEGLTDADLSAVDRAARAHCATLLVMNSGTWRSPISTTSAASSARSRVSGHRWRSARRPRGRGCTDCCPPPCGSRPATARGRPPANSTNCCARWRTNGRGRVAGNGAFRCGTWCRPGRRRRRSASRSTTAHS